MKFFNSHLSTEQIADAIENRLAASERASFQAHLENCSHCADEYKNLARSIKLMRADRSIDAPPDALNFARNLFRAGKRFEPRADSLTNKILATLKLDVPAFSAVFGERSAGASAERQMLFEAGEFDVDVRIRAAENDCELAGQILGSLPETISLNLQKANFDFQSSVNELGEFKIENVTPGNYDLIFRIGDSEIIINDLKIE